MLEKESKEIVELTQASVEVSEPSFKEVQYDEFTHQVYLKVISEMLHDYRNGLRHFSAKEVLHFMKILLKGNAHIKRLARIRELELIDIDPLSLKEKEVLQAEYNKLTYMVDSYSPHLDLK